MSAFLDAIRHTLEGEGIDTFSVGPCRECRECRRLAGYGDHQIADFRRDLDQGDICDEGSFGKCICESCGPTVAGMRYDAHGFVDGELFHYSVCADCLVYHTNGEEPELWEGVQS